LHPILIANQINMGYTSKYKLNFNMMKKLLLLCLFAFSLSFGFSQTQNALDFDGNNDHVVIGQPSELDFTPNSDPLSVSVWFKVESGNSGAFISKASGAGSANHQFQLGYSSSDIVFAEMGASRIDGTQSYDDGLWHHACVTSDGSTFRLYIDGVMENSGSPGSYTAPFDWLIGARRDAGNSGTGFQCDDVLDEVRIWDVQLTLAQIKNNMYREITDPNSEANLIAYYQFNETSGTNLPDQSSNSNDGTLTNMDPATDWVSSTAPIPYYSVADGNWNSNATWATGQNAPANAWSRVMVGDDVTVSAAAACEEVTVVDGGSLLDNGNLTATSAVVERDYTGNTWHLISSPITGAVSEMFTGLYLMSHGEPSNGYTDVVDLDVPLTPGQGFALWNQNGDATASYTGTLTTTATASLTRTADGFDNGWNLVGNPYPSSIDWEATAGWTKTNLNNAIYIENNGGWATYIGGAGVNGGTRYIASGQGFFVAVSDGQTTGTLGFSNDVRVHDNTTFFKEEPAYLVKLKVSGNGFSDETVVYFKEEATIGFDGQLDAYKIPSFEESAPYIYSTANQGMAINVLPEVTTVPMNVKVGTETGTFTIEALSTGEFSELNLKDLSTGVITDLNSDSYTFNYIPGVDNRFELHFGPLGVNDLANNLYNVYSYNKEIHVITPNTTSGNITVYDMMGKEVASQSISGTDNVITLSQSAHYIVKVISEEGLVTKKVYIK